MAITTVGTPIGGGNFNPGYNPVVWYFNSTLKNNNGYRYLVDLYEKTGPSTQDLIATLEIPPRPDDGYCVADIGRTLSNYLTYQQITQGHATEADKSYLRYNIEVRDKYLVSYTWEEYGQATGAPDPFSQYTLLTFDEALPFIVNDQIFVEQSDGGVEQPLLEGILTVLYVQSSNSIVVNRLWSAIEPNEPVTQTVTGVTSYADGRKFIGEVDLEVEDKTVFNGALPHVDLRGYNVSRFTQTPLARGFFLTSIPLEFTVRPETRLLLNVWNDFKTVDNFNWIYLENDGGTVKRRQANSTTVPILSIPSGPGNIQNANYSLVSGPDVPIINTDTKWYKMWAAADNGTRVSKEYKFNLDRTCGKFDLYELVFLDRLGSLGSFSFYYRTDISQGITREDQNYILGDLSGGQWTFNASDAGSKVSFVDLTNQITFNTAWLTQEDSNYFQELVSSPFVVMNIDGQYFPLIITDTQSEKKDKRSNKNIRYTLTAKFANNDTVNW